VCFFCYEKDDNNIVIYCEEDNKHIVVIIFFLCVFLYFKIQLKPLLKEVKVFTKRFFLVPKNEKTTRKMILLMPWLMNDAYGLLDNIH